jgi:hypothetical protein
MMLQSPPDIDGRSRQAGQVPETLGGTQTLVANLPRR